LLSSQKPRSRSLRLDAPRTFASAAYVIAATLPSASPLQVASGFFFLFVQNNWMKLPIIIWLAVVGWTTACLLSALAARLPVTQCKGFLRHTHAVSGNGSGSPLPHPHLPLPRINSQQQAQRRCCDMRANLVPPSKVPATFSRKNWSGTSVLGVPILATQHVLLRCPSGSYQQVMFDLPTEDTMQPLGGQSSSVGMLLQHIFPIVADQARFLGG
jgi:hypothetical protein